MPRSSLSEFLDESNQQEQQKQASLPDRYQKYVKEQAFQNDETESTADLSDVSSININRRASIESSSASSIPWYAQFEANDAFNAQENAILMNLSKQLNLLQQNDAIGMVEESTIQNKRRVSQSIKRMSLHASIRRNSITELPNEEDYEEEEKRETPLLLDFPGAKAAKEAERAAKLAQAKKRETCAVTRFVDNQLFFLAPQFRKFSQGVDSWQARCDDWARCMGARLDALLGQP